ncbi:MAG: tetratricopeptide repeat protein [Vicinamibacterales bacterium]|nr:tetratricopeptide repeat protein [Vicinamibacterales bacterium]
MAETTRIDELRRRLQKDPASIAFAQLAEEYRRAGKYQEAVETCRAGLTRHPGYLSARVTLGRALLEVGELEAAQVELNDVLMAAPQNLAAIRGLAEIHRRRGELREALDQYRTAFELARNDPGIDQIVRDLRRELGPAGGRPTSTQPAPGTPAEAAPVARPRETAFVAALEGWLGAILEDRRRRLYQTPA